MTQTVREMLINFGVPDYLASPAIPFMQFTPSYSDPDSPQTIQVIKGLQNGLRMLGYHKVKSTGVFTVDSAIATKEISGPAWRDKTWIQLYGDIQSALENPSKKAHDMETDMGLGSYFEYHGPPVGPLPGRLIGTPPGPLGMGDTASDQGVVLTFGKGIKNPSNMVPIDANTKSAFVNLQKQTNRILSAMNASLVSEDGIIGVETLAGFRRAAEYGVSKAQTWGEKATAEILKGFLSKTTTAGIASVAISAAIVMKQVADNIGAAASVSTAAAKPKAPIKIDSTSVPMTVSDIQKDELVGKLKKYAPYAGIAVGAALAFKYFGKKKRK